MQYWNYLESKDVWGLCQFIELHIGKRRPFLFICSHVPSLGTPISLKCQYIILGLLSCITYCTCPLLEFITNMKNLTYMLFKRPYPKSAFSSLHPRSLALLKESFEYQIRKWDQFFERISTENGLDGVAFLWCLTLSNFSRPALRRNISSHFLNFC